MSESVSKSFAKKLERLPHFNQYQLEELNAVNIKRGLSRVETTILDDEKRATIVSATIAAVRELLILRKQQPVAGWEERLSRTVDRLARGSKLCYRTPYFKDRKVPEVVEFMLQLCKRSLHNWSVLGEWYGDLGAGYQIETEESHAQKAGETGAYLPFPYDGKDKLFEVMSNSSAPKLDRRAWNNALSRLSHFFPEGHFKLGGVNAVLKGMMGNIPEEYKPLDDKTYSGYPGFRTGWVPVASYTPRNKLDELSLKQTYSWIYDTATGIIQQARSGKPWTDMHVSTVGMTFQRINVPKGDNPFLWDEEKGKFVVKRIVIAQDKGTNTLPLSCVMTPQFQLECAGLVNPVTKTPLLLAHQRPEVTAIAIEADLSEARRRSQRMLSVDFSGFDAHVVPDLYWEVVEAVSTWFEPSARQVWLSCVHANIFDTTIVYPGGIITPRPSKIKSGSKETNHDDSFYNLTIQMYGGERGYYSPWALHAQGDDGLIGADSDDLPAAFERAAEECGQSANRSKGAFWVDACNFTQMNFFRGRPGGVGSIARVTGRCLNLEDDVGFGYDTDNVRAKYTVQLASRLGNLAMNPGFETVVQAFKEADRYALMSDKPADLVAKLAGDYYTKSTAYATRVKGKLSGRNSYADQPFNRVVRGEKLPTDNEDRFLAVYGIRPSSVAVNQGLYIREAPVTGEIK